MVKVAGLMMAGAIVLLVVAGILQKKEPSSGTVAPTEKAQRNPADGSTSDQQAPSPRQDTPATSSIPSDSTSQAVTRRPVNIAGRWGGSDGLSYQVQQQGTIIVMAGGYPNQAIIVTGRGMVSGRTLEVEFMRADAAVGKASFHVAADGRSMQGRYQTNTGEWGNMIMRKY